MDSITHTLTGVVIAKAIGDERIGNWGTAVGISMGLFPDVDFVFGLFDPQFYLEYHRDFTHSLLLIPFYAFFFSWVFLKISRRPYFWSFFKICLSVLISHIILDLLTSYGTMILSPLSEHRFSWDLIFIIDLIFSAIIAIPLLGSLFFRRNALWICRGSLISLIFYIILCWVEHNQALHLTWIFARGLEGEVIQIASLPQPLSPFRWANYIETRERVYQGFVDLLRSEEIKSIDRDDEKVSGSSFIERLKRLNELYRPPAKVQYRSWEKFNGSPWVEKALKTEGVRFYYWFARFPVVKSVNSKEGRHRVEFMDVRFFLPGIRMPFIYFVEFNDSGGIQSEGFLEYKGRKANH